MARSFVQGPNQTYQLISHAIPGAPEEPDHVLVKFGAAPVNRVDVLSLTGKYPVKPKFALDGRPIPGFDGCGVVQASTSPLFSAGDVVLPRLLGQGTWRTHSVLPAASLMAPLPAGTSPLDASLLRSGALVAWLLLEEVSRLDQGDYIMVNAGTSCVAQFLAQLARQRGVHAILVIRDREPEALAEVKERLLSLGAVAVLTEAELPVNSPRDGQHQALVGKVKLALDCVSGAIGEQMIEWLAPGGKFVLVGMLAGASTGMKIRTEHLFYKQLSFVPFRSSEVLKNLGDEKVEQIVARIAQLFIDGKLKAPQVNTVHWENREAVELEAALRDAVKETQDNKAGYKKTVWIY
ncbi:hypothetical protein M426DRAFT_67199 [Hypoxylon sp. CI-4A]|nr:hypothetical protein M426DRAFT_67199 [Hypoxylon sp. CI-4A]